VLEAMASGLPVVSTNSVGVVDCITHDVDGLLHEPGDVAGLR
jgi:glycosyltransferase involved in cell wall biosynthesis